MLLVTGTITVPPNPVQLERHLLSPCFAAIWSHLQLPTDPCFGHHFGHHKTANLVRRLAYWPG